MTPTEKLFPEEIFQLGERTLGRQEQRKLDHYWVEKSGLPLRRFFNTSGLLYKGMALKDKLPEMTDNEQYILLGEYGMLVKRPLIVADDFVLVGFREAEWSAALG